MPDQRCRWSSLLLGWLVANQGGTTDQTRPFTRTGFLRSMAYVLRWLRCSERGQGITLTSILSLRDRRGNGAIPRLVNGLWGVMKGACRVVEFFCRECEGVPHIYSFFKERG